MSEPRSRHIASTAASSEEADLGPGALTTREAAHALGLNERDVRRAIAQGDLAGSKRSGRYLISAAEIDRFGREVGRLRPRLTLLPAPAEPSSVVPFPGGRHAAPAVLPAPLTRFVGRDAEIAAATALLRREDVRLLTLTGPGGAGKTRLALEIAARVGAELPHGVAFVPLAAVRDAGLVAASVALALEVRGAEDQTPSEWLRRGLRERRLLLLLDNFEQVLSAGPLLSDLLASCPGLTCLVTSRAALRLSGERVFAVPPLTLPRQAHAAPALPSLAELAENDAVRLFVDRAETAAGAFALTAGNAAAVVGICERADGLPLAIELAAAGAAFLSPQALLERLDPRLPLLADGPRDQPARLRTMRDAIGWSYALLTAEEQALFRSLSVFVGGCTMEAVEWVGGRVSGVGSTTGRTSFDLRLSTSDSMLNLMRRLVDQAVVQQQIDGAGQPRFTMLETIREYGLEQLAASGDETAVRESHAVWCVAFAERAEPELAGPDQEIWVRRIDADLGNVRAAHAWLAARGDTESALRLAGAIGWFWSSTPYLEEARGRFDAVLAMPGVAQHPAALAKALNTAGDIADWQGDQPRARGHYERALGIYRGLGDQGQAAGILRGLGSSAIDRGEIDLALSLLEESLALAGEVGHAWELAAASNLMGTAHSVRGNYDVALARHEDAARAWRDFGDDGHVTTALASAAWAAWQNQEARRAAEAYRETMDRALAGKDSWYVSWSVIGGGLAAARGDAKLAVALLAAGLAQRERLGAMLRPHVQNAIEAAIADLRAQLGDRVFAARWQAGWEMSLEEAAARAAAIFDDILRERPNAYGLTRRERDVLRLLAEGMADKEIASALFVARATASKHVAAILDKLGVDSRTAAVALALRHNLL